MQLFEFFTKENKLMKKSLQILKRFFAMFLVVCTFATSGSITAFAQETGENAKSDAVKVEEQRAM